MIRVKKRFTLITLIIGLIVAIVSFTLLFVGVKYVLNTTIVIQNIIAYIILSALLGSLSAILFLFKQKVSFIIFNVGIVIGFIAMYNIFNNSMDGWNDLAGFMTFLFTIGIGLIIGIVVQLFFELLKK